MLLLVGAAACSSAPPSDASGREPSPRERSGDHGLHGADGEEVVRRTPEGHGTRATRRAEGMHGAHAIRRAPGTQETRAMTVSALEADPASVGMEPAGLERIDSLLRSTHAGAAAPGAALAIGRRGGLARLRGYGTLGREVESPVTPRTIYDLASLTKVVATTTAVMILDEEGRLGLDDPVALHLPWWSGGDPAKASVTVRDLLLHRAGLPAFRPWFRELRGEEAYREALAAEPLERAPGEATVYSDLGALTLGFVVEAASGRPLDRFVRENVLDPLGMRDTAFRPDAALLERIAPTELDTLLRHEQVRGVVHDENAWAMGGVAGHAGLFSTAADLAVFAAAMLAGGGVGPCAPEPGSGTPCPEPRPDSVRVVGRESVARYTGRHDAGSSRALGWDTPSGRSSAGRYFTGEAFGHTGFTGTSIWIDPELDLYVVLLTNRVDPTRENTAHVALRREVHDLAALALADRVVRPRPPGGSR